MHTKALLVSAPFGPLNLPSIGLSLLRAVAEKQGFPADIRYLGIDFAKTIGVDLYSAISIGYPSNTSLVGDFLFASYFYRKSRSEIDRFIDSYVTEPRIGNPRRALAPFFDGADYHVKFRESYRKAVGNVSAWVAAISAHLAQCDADVYGFTSMFQQTLASLSIARALKRLRPTSLIVFGGPNCEDPMGSNILDEYSCVDLICSGEGEHAFISILEHVESAGHTDFHPNIRQRGLKKTNYMTDAGSRRITQLETSPLPDYDDYFAQLASIRDHANIEPRVLLETSRGCWWGQKAHCTFCGLNGSSMSFRSKSPEKALADIKHLRAKYPRTPISVVDNIIDYRYFATLLPMLASEQLEVELFYETKANLSKMQLAAMRRAGITRIQPGIESLSSHVLKLMRKGVKAIQNVCLLKWCVEEGVKPEWNLLWGFPNERPDDYSDMAALVPKLTHLVPPNASARLRLDRYSPLYANRAHEPITDVRPYSAYYDVYDVPEHRLANLAYYFTFTYRDHRNVESYTDALAKAIEGWKQHHQNAYLIYATVADITLIFDGRTVGMGRVLQYDIMSGRLLQLCETPTSIDTLLKKAEHMAGDDDTRACVTRLIEDGIMISLDGVLFNVAIELSRAQRNNVGFEAFLHELIAQNISDSEDVIAIDIRKRKEPDAVRKAVAHANVVQ